MPEGQTIILSAHGVSPEVRRVCAERSLRVIDATCPLVAKVHAEVRRFAGRGATVLLVGHADHDEVIGTRGEAPDAVILVEDIADAETVEVPDPSNVALTTQTTLSIDDTTAIVEVLKRRFPALVGPKSSDICYATQNRQDAVRSVVGDGADLVLVVGSRNSSNSMRMVEVARAAGSDAHLIDNASELDPAWLAGRRRVALTAGASAPEVLVQEVATTLVEAGYARTGEEEPSAEGVVFALPREVRPPAALARLQRPLRAVAAALEGPIGSPPEWVARPMPPSPPASRLALVRGRARAPRLPDAAPRRPARRRRSPARGRRSPSSAARSPSST